jgi:Zn-dependent peptidase ImmA (M78 family)/transcriptional regulator with XRE-family HTH domain
MKPNPEMVILAREYRGLTQAELAEASGLNQPRVARVEAGTGAELSDVEMATLSKALAFPQEFFFLSEQRYGYGSSSVVFTRTRQLKADERRRVSGLVNVMRIQIKRMLDHIDINPSRVLHKMSLDDYLSPSDCATALRAAWNLPSGPIRNMTTLLEAAGVIIVECDFGMSPMDATSVQLPDLPTMIFISKNVPGDRWRFTLAHELAHLVMHDVPRPTMEKEADEFASEFLVPSDEVAPDFTRMHTAQLESYVSLKQYWGVSIAALVMKGKALGKLSENQAKWLFIQMAKRGMRQNEPAPIQREKPTLFPMIVDHFRTELEFDQEEFAKAIMFNPECLSELYNYTEAPSRPKLRVIR